jgi:hypothetical protein
MTMEMELEDIRTMIEFFKDNKEQFMLVGQLNHISETSVRMEILVSTKADYNGQPVLVTYVQPVGTAKLPYDDTDTVNKQKLDDLEGKLRLEKEKMKRALNEAGFNVAYGVWKTLG